MMPPAVYLFAGGGADVRRRLSLSAPPFPFPIVDSPPDATNRTKGGGFNNPRGNSRLFNKTFDENVLRVWTGVTATVSSTRTFVGLT